MSLIVISKNSIIVLICVLLLIIGVIQGKYRKPKRIRDIEKREKEKMNSYKNETLGVLYVSGFTEKVENTSGFLGIRGHNLVFFVDKVLIQEEWKIETRSEEIIMDFSKINSIEIKKDESMIEIIYTNSQSENIIYEFKIDNSENAENFIDLVKSEKAGF